MIKNILKTLICYMCVVSLLTGCGNLGNKPEDSVTESSGQTSASVLADENDKENETDPDNLESQSFDETSPEYSDEMEDQQVQKGNFEFKPVVVSSVFRDITGEDMYDAYCNYVNAVQNGKDEFEVKDADTYDWMIGQYPGVCYPLLKEYTESYYADAYSDGKATFQYKISKEELKKKEAEFEDIVTGILNKTMRNDYSDFEKILALYEYFCNQYTYDYDMYEESQKRYVEEVNAYRFLTTGHGICSECAPAFSYLLLQAGVDATVAGGTSEVTGEGHEWTYVTINGKNYHVDATYGMDSGVYLSYLMMTDEQRENEDGYKKDEMLIGCRYKEDINGASYTADDDFFAPLWGGYLDSWDHEKKIINYTDKDGNPATFDYSSFE